MQLILKGFECYRLLIAVTCGWPVTREPHTVWVGVITLEQKRPLAIVNVKNAIEPDCAYKEISWLSLQTLRTWLAGVLAPS
jgi:hypothetical protein